MIVFRCNYLRLRHYSHKRYTSSTTRIVQKGELPSPAYKPEIVERDKYEKWEQEARFRADASSGKPTFSMVLPPPNITGKLHLGHALACTVQDVIARRKRAMGFNVLWLPGTDHAGIATQGVVEKHLSKRNITRHDIGRDKFVKQVWKWREKHGDTICQQLQTMGCSLDWSRQMFTMDPTHSHAVNTAFINLFRKGLIYRKKALVNWCNSLNSTVSDIEVENVIIKGPTDLKLPGYSEPVRFGQMYDFAYKVCDSGEELVVSTTMPETMLGDTAVVVHPDDDRYKHLKGKRVHHPFRNDSIPIIFDEFVDMKFGTGAVKITPAHSKIDYEIASKHHLPMLQIIDEGVMINSGKFDSLKRYDCRKLLVDKLDEMGLLKDVIPHEMSLPTCSRTEDVIDHLPKEQWFLACKELNEKAADLVRNGKLNILPEKFINNWMNWTNDDRDWCISRQLWWGHQIPAYKCSIGREFVWTAASDESSAKIQAAKLLRTLPDEITAERDSDVLDTWFSSGVYPFSSLGWPGTTKDYENYYPLNLMATGHDILGFWVHRMVILGLELTEKLPFHNVLLHGIICDNKGAKMSKSKGNVIDPVDVIKGISIKELKDKSQDMYRSGVLSKYELDKALAYHKANFYSTNGIPECGVDALRFSLLSHDIKSHFINFDVAICHSNKLFCNKIWQSVKYMQLSFAKLKPIDREITTDDLTYFDKWILSRLANMVEKVNASMDDYDFHLATKAIRKLLYNEYCDVYLEATKPGFDCENLKIGYAHAHTLSVVLNTALRCLSPFMIYVTEEVIPKIPSFETNIIRDFNDKNTPYDFPRSEDFDVWKNHDIEVRVEKLLSSMNLVRELKGWYNISNKLRPKILISSKDKDLIDDIKDNKNIFLNLTRCSGVDFETDDRKYVTCVLDSKTEISVEMLGDDVENAILSARHKFEKRIKKLEHSLLKMEEKVSSNSFIETVPELTQLVEIEKLSTKRKELEQLQRLSVVKNAQ